MALPLALFSLSQLTLDRQPRYVLKSPTSSGTICMAVVNQTGGLCSGTLVEVTASETIACSSEHTC